MNIAKYIDHTILKPDVKKKEIIQYCKDAKTYGFFSVCVNGSNVAIVADELKGSDVKVTAVVGFPLGASTMEVKAFETSNAIDNGANEIDMVINIGALKSKEYDLVYKDIEAVVNAAKSKAIVKVIIETSLLTDEEKVKVCELAKQAGADFVKTSTGFSTGGATAEDVKLMKETVGENVQVKASGGVRDYKTAITMIEAGATRIGCSASISIVKGIEDQQGGY
ncbi:deoxyribose-phosphate aldolase [Alkaliphilus peptidifermentans]|uniref:Deoxyribose-phosphate aldolase n=1 Tax=Alkaliphilus peptidifermentans DSM 18978 TaxID=1120976 RepID=A0A1G5BGU3_9FIRM|nr:deoxyribose-phosphate aldolase [Alkaliphilus peptidifermentans]SCX89341.1 deoxyribose-phosphate aldolase [Alkaliphilus peptidifermentans DSM 18978]